MMDKLAYIKQQLKDNSIAEAIQSLDAIIQCDDNCEEAYFLRGNAYRRLGNWKMAISDYSRAKEINPEGAGAIAYQSAYEVLNFYHTDLYNP